MKLIVLVLNKKELLNDILEKFLEIGITGATILDSTGMGQSLATCNEITFFGGLRKVLQDCRPHNVTIFSVVESEELLKKTINVLDEILGGINNPGTGIVFTLNIEDVFGMAKPYNDDK